MNPLPELLAGDHLIYTGFDLVDWGIMLKTGSKACHIEVYLGGGSSFASRNGIGVDKYPLRLKGLSYVLRPTLPMNIEQGMAWFYSLNKKERQYAWRELANFYLPFGVIKGPGMICSTAAACFDHHSRFHPFNIHWLPEKIAPADFLKVGPFDWVWTRKG